MDRYRDRRSPDRERSRYSPAPGRDSYVPGESRGPRPRSRSPQRYRPRSRSPPRGDTWRGGRPRSPPRRFESRGDAYPPRDTRLQSPHRATRDYIPADDRFDDRARARSPPPGLKRGREPSPPRRGMRSPLPPTKRERLESPPRDYGRARSPPRRAYSPPRHSPMPPARSDYRNDYRPRSRSPPRRDDRPNPYLAESWRRRSPSPRASKAGSMAGSRRGSPRPHQPRVDRYDDPRGAPFRPRSPGRPRSPLSATPSRRSSPPPRQRTPPRENRQNHALRDHDYGHDDRAPPTGPTSGSYYGERAPPTGPSSNRFAPLAEASAGGPPSAPLSMSAHNMPGSAGPPTYPRGGFRGRGGPPASGGREYPPRDYPPRGGYAAPFGRGGAPYDRPPTREGYNPRASYDSRAAPPTFRPRESVDGTGGANAPPMFRSSNSTSTTYPRTQRFNTQLGDVAQVKSGGQRAPPLVDQSKADKLEEEAARLRKMIDDKQQKKRVALKDWEKLEGDVKIAALRSDLADEHLRALSGETTDGLAAAAF